VILRFFEMMLMKNSSAELAFTGSFVTLERSTYCLGLEGRLATTDVLRFSEVLASVRLGSADGT
jgi:hypothetical protein